MRVIVGVSLALLLAACEGASEPDETAAVEDGGKAVGEILGGTISDDMLPLAELRSQSPPRAPVAEPGAVSGAPGAGPQEPGAEAADQTDPSAEPAAPSEPAPAPEPRAR